MFGFGKTEPITVWAQGTLPVELARGKETNPKKRVPLLAEVDATTGEVTFRVRPEDLPRLGR